MQVEAIDKDLHELTFAVQLEAKRAADTSQSEIARDAGVAAELCSGGKKSRPTSIHFGASSLGECGGRRPGEIILAQSNQPQATPWSHARRQCSLASSHQSFLLRLVRFMALRRPNHMTIWLCRTTSSNIRKLVFRVYVKDFIAH